jgi:uncharacterized protein
MMANELTLVDEFVIPKKSGRAFKVIRGQVLRVIAPEGPQVADLNAFNLDDYTEHFSASRTRTMEGMYVREGTKLYSNPGHEQVMIRVIRDPIGIHDTLGARCSSRLHKNKFGTEGYVGCHELLAEAITPYGLGANNVHDVLAIFMRREIDEAGNLVTLAPNVRPGDSIDLLAEMDLLVAVAACPSEKIATNDYVAKAIGIQILK